MTALHSLSSTWLILGPPCPRRLRRSHRHRDHGLDRLLGRGRFDREAPSSGRSGPLHSRGQAQRNLVGSGLRPGLVTSPTFSCLMISLSIWLKDLNGGHFLSFHLMNRPVPGLCLVQWWAFLEAQQSKLTRLAGQMLNCFCNWTPVLII